jgi:hypothetical protein
MSIICQTFGKENLMWEEIKQTNERGFVGGSYAVSERMKVPGGWIVRSRMYNSHGVSVHQIFVPDPNHSWKLEN